jgi:hypothetical protein
MNEIEIPTLHGYAAHPSRDRDAFPDIIDTAYPTNEPLKTKTETSMGSTSISKRRSVQNETRNTQPYLLKSKYHS